MQRTWDGRPQSPYIHQYGCAVSYITEDVFGKISASIHPTVGKSQVQQAHRQGQCECAYQHTDAQKDTKYPSLNLYESKGNHTAKMQNHKINAGLQWIRLLVAQT